jgi:L-seryl-tRNA(Ser) seleniumtransferase
LSYPFKSKVLERLGVRSWINAKNWSTVIGGTWIDDRVLEAMNEVAKTFVDMHELIAKADKRIAELCQVEEAHVTTGTGAAMGLVVAGCMAEGDYGKWIRLPHTEMMRNQVVMARGHNIAYTPQWTASGAHVVEYGQAGSLRAFDKELENAIGEDTCCIAHTLSYNVVPRGVIPLESVIRVAGKRSLPVVVDAASMLPPVENLHKYTDKGADVVIFSGGKAIKAPNNTGIMLGKGKGAKIIENVREHSFPHSGWGRGFKISKEQIVGLVTALEIFVEEGDSYYAKQMGVAERVKGELEGIPGVEVSIIPNNESYHEHVYSPHVPRVLIQWDAGELGLTGVDVDEAMAVEEPPIYLRSQKYHNYFTNREWRQVDTYYLRPSEELIVAERLRRVLTRN